jgi:hypothetical protein
MDRKKSTIFKHVLAVDRLSPMSADSSAAAAALLEAAAGTFGISRAATTVPFHLNHCDPLLKISLLEIASICMVALLLC